MEYVTGIHALNTSCNLETTGDWHTSALRWDKPTVADSTDNRLHEWGIEEGCIPQEDGTMLEVKKANHLRAILDILMGVTDTPLSSIKFFKKDWFCTDIYDLEFMQKVTELRDISNWDEINTMMAKEFGRKWTHYTGE